MKIIGTILVSLLFFGLLQAAFAGNGVERGSISFGDSAVPEILQNPLELAIFGNCDLHGALDITPSFVKESYPDGLESNGNYSSYDMQFAVRFEGGQRTVYIYVSAVVRQGNEPKGVIVRLDSPICRAI